MTRTGLPRYEDAVQHFRIEDEIARLDGDPATGINAYVECCGRHTGSNRLALRAISAGGELRQFSFEDLADMSGRVGNLLKDLGVGPCDVVAGMLPRIPELVALILGTWRIGAVYQPLFTAFGPKAVEHRLGYSGAKLVVTNPANRGKLDEIESCPRVATILDRNDTLPQGDTDFRAAIAAVSPDCEPVMRKGSDLFMMMSTSGTTGLPKGVPVPLGALLAFGAYMRDAIGLRRDDIFWNIADPGWAYGLYYAVTGPLQLGIATTFNEGPFNARSTYEVIERLGVTSLAGSPTAFRLLLAEGPAAAARVKGRLRVVSSAGEPLNPEVIRWFDAHLGAPIHDHYGQTENGMMVNNHHGLAHKVRTGSSGFAMPGYRMVVLDEAGNELGPNQP
ncbi:MAG: AMP-binding protein, partial [Mesorhizobium sp.]